jgi:PAS domain S-box-containing protein
MPSQKIGNLLETVPDALVGVDRAGMTRLVNRQVESLFGYEREDLVGASIKMLVPESVRQVHRAHRAGYDAAPRTRPMGTGLRLIGRRADGSEFPVDIALSPMHPGDRMLVMAAVRDMTNHFWEQGGRGRLDLLAAIVEHSDDAIISSTLDAIITSWNPAAERLYGYCGQEMIGNSVDLLSPKDRTDEIRAVLARIKAGEHVDHCETKRVRKDGTTFPASLTISPIRDTNGAIIGASVISRDVTEQRNGIEAGQRMASIVEHSLDAIISMTLQDIITGWNPAAERLYGYSSQEVIGRSSWLLVPQDRADETRAVLEKIRAGETVEHHRTIRVRKDGTPVPISLTASPICDADGTIIGTSTIARDLTRQEEAAELSRSLIEASPDLMVSISPGGKITDVNEATVRLTGIPRDTLIGTDFSGYFTEPAKANQGYQRVLAQGSVTDYPLTMRHRDGTLSNVLYNASVYRDTSGKVLGVFAAARDMTKQVKAQRKIAAQQARELRRLAELERFQRLTVGRELRMIELKKEIVYLRKFGPNRGGEPNDER